MADGALEMGTFREHSSGTNHLEALDSAQGGRQRPSDGQGLTMKKRTEQDNGPQTGNKRVCRRATPRGGSDSRLVRWVRLSSALLNSR